MSYTRKKLNRSNDLDFLKSIVGDDKHSISPINEEDEEGRYAFLPASQRNSHGDHAKRVVKDSLKFRSNRHRHDQNEEEDYEDQLSRTEMWARGDLDDSRLEKRRVHRKPPISKSDRHLINRPQSGKASLSGCDASGYQMSVDAGAHRLERKYNELKQLLMNNGPRNYHNPNNNLMKLATKMARKYHVEAHSMVSNRPMSSKGNNRLNEENQKTNPRLIYSPRDDKDEYILIDGTGSMVKTTKVRFIPSSDASINSNSSDTQRGRTRIRKTTSAKKRVPNAWASKSNSQVSSQRSTPHKISPRSSSGSFRKHSPSEKKTTNDYSDSFTSDSSPSRSRSRSNSKGKAVDLHLKYTKNEKLLEWLKKKDDLHRSNLKQERKEKRNRRKADRDLLVEKEEIKETSLQKVSEWMTMKRTKARLLRRAQKPLLDQLSAVQDLVVIDEMLDLREHGARIDPSNLPKHLKGVEQKPGNDIKGEENNKNEEVGKIPKRPSSACPATTMIECQNGRMERGRPQSAKAMPFGRRVSGQKSRFSDGAKQRERLHKEKVLKEIKDEEDKRMTYNDWIKSKRTPSQAKANNELADEAKPGCNDSACGGGDDNGLAKDNSQSKITKVPSTSVDNSSALQTQVPRKARPKTSTVRARLKKQPPIPDLEVVEKVNVSHTDEPVTTPKPEYTPGEAYNKIKHEQRSWDKFSDFAWKDANNAEVGNEHHQQDQQDQQGQQDSDTSDTTSMKSNINIATDVAQQNNELSEISESDESKVDTSVSSLASEDSDNEQDNKSIEDPQGGFIECTDTFEEFSTQPSHTIPNDSLEAVHVDRSRTPSLSNDPDHKHTPVMSGSTLLTTE